MPVLDNPEGPRCVQRGIDLDRILAEEVGLGWYQLRAVLLLGLTLFFFGFTIHNYIFTAQRVRTRCLIPECEVKTGQDFSPSWVANAVPSSGQSFDNCHRFAPAPSTRNFTPWSCPADMFDNSSIVECTDYVYEHTNSAVYEFGLACDEWRWFSIGATRALGVMLALLASGVVADRAGRRVALSLNVVSFVWVNALTSGTTSYTTYIITTFVASMLGGALLPCVYVIALEQVEPKHRMITSAILNTCTCLGLCCLGLVASLELYWRHFLLIIYLPLFFGVSFFWIMPESVRWLNSKNRFEESKAILIKAAQMNGRVLSEETLKSFSDLEIRSKKEQSIQNHGLNLICLLFRHKTILFYFIIICVWRLTEFFVSNSLVISSVVISGNKFVNHVVVAAAPIPAVWLTLLAIDRVGMKPALLTGFSFCGACLLAFIFVPKGYYGISLTLYLLGRFGMAAVSSLLKVYSLELFPTSSRTRLFTCSAMIGKIGEVVAPLTPALAAGVWESLPFALFGGLAWVSALLVLPAPETRGRALPDTEQVAANLGRALPRSAQGAAELGRPPPCKLMDVLRRIVERRHCYSL